MVHPSENASFKFHDLFFIQWLIQPFPHPKNFIWTKTAFSGQHWTGDHPSKSVKKFGSNKKINFSNELVKKQTIYDLLFIIAIYSPQNVNKQSSEMKNKHQNSLFTTSTVFLGLEPILYAGQNLWLTAKLFRKLFLVVDCPIKSSVVQSNRFIF